MKIRIIRITVINLMIAAFVSLSTGCSSKRSKGDVSGNLNYSTGSFRLDSTVIVGQTLFNRDLILKLYKGGGAHPVPKWNNRNKIDQMITAIHNALLDGLNPDDYHLREIENLKDKMALSTKVKPEDAARLELLLTDSFLLLAYHLSVGKTDPETIYPEWEISKKNADINWGKLIDSALNSNNIPEVLQKITPRHSDYYNLKKALAKYRLIEGLGGWEGFVTRMPKLQKGDRNPDVVLLRKRLAATQGDIPYVAGDEDLFDEFLKDQVIQFQKLNSLDPDGVVGKATIRELNIPVKERILILESNLERWRWISDDLGRRYIKVNIANFDLSLVENEKPVLQAAAVVGEPYKQTPVFSSVLHYLVLNPDWTIPEDILKEEIIPEIKKNHSYLIKNKMKVLRMDGTEVDTASINWNSVIADDFPYMIRQDPGPVNALGRIQFLFPNKYIVYIHDTPFKYLFSQNSRAFSHGCIRINKAFELAEYLLKDQPEWDSLAIQKVIDQGEKRIIRLQNPVPVHILYLTAWADNDGRAYFGKDIYKRDSVLIDALDRIPPGPGTK
jgi:murein L,D-transpeptidase YcbB/YkuD